MNIAVDTDVDIDVYDRESIIGGLECIFAGITRPNKHEKHPTGLYFQNIPRDPATNVASLDHKKAAEYGYFKIDMLNVYMYAGVRNETHLNELIETEPNWELFQYKEITDNLFHLKGHHRLLAKYKPTTVEELAMILAIIRPAKAYLQDSSWEQIKAEVWLKNTNGDYTFKKAHGIAYAIAVVVHLNLMIEELEDE